MIKFKITKALDHFGENEVDYRLEFMNGDAEWESLGFFNVKEDARKHAEKFAGVYEEEIFSI